MDSWHESYIERDGVSRSIRVLRSMNTNQRLPGLSVSGMRQRTTELPPSGFGAIGQLLPMPC
jgi:hypothetical protein